MSVLFHLFLHTSEQIDRDCFCLPCSTHMYVAFFRDLFIVISISAIFHVCTSFVVNFGRKPTFQSKNCATLSGSE